MDFARISMLEEGLQSEIMKEFLKFKKKILKYLDTWEKIIISRLEQGIEMFSITKLVYPCIEPVVDLDSFYNYFHDNLKMKQNVLKWEQMSDTSLNHFQKNMQELYQITMTHFNQPKMRQPNQIHYIFQPQIASIYLKLEHNRIKRIIKPDGKWQLAFLYPKLDYTMGVDMDENSISLQIIEEGFSMVGVACPSEYQQVRFEYPKRKTTFYSISSQGYVETIVQSEQNENSVFKYKPRDIVSITANKTQQTLIFSNRTTGTIQKLTFLPKDEMQYHFFVGLRRPNEEVVVHTL